MPTSNSEPGTPNRENPPTRAESEGEIPAELKEFIRNNPAPKGFVNDRPLTIADLRARMAELRLKPAVPLERLQASINRLRPAPLPVEKMSEDVKASVRALKPETRRFHGAKLALSWFPFPPIVSPCADRFGYMSSAATRSSTQLPFNPVTQALLGQLGNLMGDPGRDPNSTSHDPANSGVSSIPAGYTYFGQFVDHDVTLDVSSSIDLATDANSINNMRSPTLDLDSVYGRGPGLDPFLYEFPSPNPVPPPLPPTAIKFQMGTNTNLGPGGPSSNGAPNGMAVPSRADVPRVPGTNTAVIGDPRNDENLIVAQFHHVMLRFHNAVVELLASSSWAGDIFAEAKRIVTHHYQWAVVNDFLKRICGATTVNTAMATVNAPIGSAFRMPVEFAVAAYRFGHSMIRDSYFVNFNFPAATLGQVFQFSRNPQLPIFSNWVVDFNAFFDTAVSAPVRNKARRIDSVMAVGLETLPGFSGLMAILATRNLRRGLALGLPSGQGMATEFGVPPMTAAQLTSGLPVLEINILNSNGGLLLNKTPLWYYILREAAVLNGGNQLGPVGGRIVAETFVRMLKRDAFSYLNLAGGFVPFLLSAVPNDFTVSDLLLNARVTLP